jgi:hypothetical protein
LLKPAPRQGCSSSRANQAGSSEVLPMIYPKTATCS